MKNENNMSVKLYWLVTMVLLTTVSGCAQQDPGNDAYLTRILSSTSYNHLGAELNKNVHIPKHDPKDMEQLFNQNKARIVKALAPYLRTYDNGAYPQISVSVYGKPTLPDGVEVVFHISVSATIAPRKGTGIRPMLDDTYSGALFLDTSNDSISRVRLSGNQLRSVPKEEMNKALALVRQIDVRYTNVDTMHVRWLPKWYVAEYIVPSQQAGKFVAGEYSFIKEMTEGYVVLLPFLGIGAASSIRQEPYHVVVVDMAASRVLGVYKTTIDMGPIYSK